MSKWTLNIGLCLMWMIVIETWIVMTQRRDQYLPKPHATDAINKFNLLVWFMFDQESDWICVATDYTQTQNAFNYDIKHRGAIKGWNYNEADLIVLSTSQPCLFYIIHQQTTSLRISRWHSEKRIREISNKLLETSYESVICFDESGNNIIIVRDEDEPSYCMKPVQWPILTGFVVDGNFYLFGHSYVYVFDEAAYHNDRKIYPFQQI
uniref:Uncharacterized protein LOC113794078 n=1 Tax=Dermatophagoides pteronyssinus TaxID=6956 RepID=A0A6P6Y3X7_DERPT